MNFCDDDFFIGDLVCVKTHFGGDAGWYQIDVDIGIVLEVIEIEKTFIYYDKKFRCYDLVIYWCKKNTIDTVPDILLEHYEYFVRRVHGK